jgi:hypothetical protein
MLTIDNYTGNWQKATNPIPPKVNSTFRTPDSPDAREWNDFKNLLAKHNMSFVFVKWMPRIKMNVYKINKYKG